ncbi:MAG: hypothetical protein ISR69_14015 [Gammaproteobacteria bacterium]|nr:hypothetical protein [Gammaproteobacteria bacterium]
MSSEEERPKVTKTLFFGVVTIAIGVFIPIIAIFVSVRPEGESLNTWFQRSGSIMVIVAVWAEVKLSHIQHLLNPTGVYTNDCLKLRKEYGTYYNLIVWLVSLIAVAGTLIWGYGDLMIENTK